MALSPADIRQGLEVYEAMERARAGAPPRSSTDMSADPDMIAFGVIVCVSVPTLLLLLYMSVFGRRMGWTAIRWHVINCTIWGLLHLAHTSSFAEKAPFANWITDQEWSDRKVQVECLTRSIFPAGMFFIYIERMLLVCSPRLEHSRMFNAFFAFCVLVVINGLVIFCFGAMYMNVQWWYNPIELFNLFTYVLFLQMTMFYFIFCLFGSCCCCFVFTREKEKRTKHPITFVDMWLLFPYALIPNIMYYPSFIVTSTSFAMKVLMQWFMTSGLMEKIMSGSGSGTNQGLFSSQSMISMMKAAMDSLPWFVMLFPLVQCILAIICLTPYREQFFFLISCGRCYNGKKIYKKDPENWRKTLAPIRIPVYPQKEKLSDSLKTDQAVIST